MNTNPVAFTITNGKHFIQVGTYLKEKVGETENLGFYVYHGTLCKKYYYDDLKSVMEYVNKFCENLIDISVEEGEYEEEDE